jgi:hypothetical protein
LQGNTARQRLAGGRPLAQTGAENPNGGQIMSCPICEKETAAAYRPFCSRRCADVDLGRWLNGSYAVPSTDPEDLEQAAAQAAQAVPKIH